MTSLDGQAGSQACGDRIATSLPLVIGLVNNMPDAAFWMTEGQFRILLYSAMPQGAALEIRRFTMPGVPRSAKMKAEIAERYEDIDALWNSRIDGLIVTGLEPRAPSLKDEPYWPTLADLIDWAAEHTRSAIWSCLAAHAAVLHLDGIERQPYAEKLLGLFACEKTLGLKTLSAMPPRWAFPHSRYNGLATEKLRAHDYRILSSSYATGADIFEKHGRSRFLFLQGHPEYDAGALLREYRRDVRRFLDGKRESYPNMPVGYFGSDDETGFADFREQAVQNRNPEMLGRFPEVSESSLAWHWHEPAIQFYNDWLCHLIAAQFSSRGAYLPRRMWSQIRREGLHADP